MAEKISGNKTIFLEDQGSHRECRRIGDVYFDWPLRTSVAGLGGGNKLFYTRPSSAAGSRCRGHLESAVAIGHIPSVSGVEEAIARSAAAVLEQTEGQLIPRVMEEVRQIGATKVDREEHEVLAKLFEQQQATIAMLQQQLEESNRLLEEQKQAIAIQGQQLTTLQERLQHQGEGQ